MNTAEKSDTDKTSEINIVIKNEDISITTKNAFDKELKIKKPNKNHGFGLTIIKEICKKYSVDYSFRAEDDTYFTYAKIKNEPC